MKRNLFIYLLIVFLSYNIHASDSDSQWLFPFGFYDDIQDSKVLNLTLNYGFLENPNLIGNIKKYENGKAIIEIPQNLLSIKINYGLWKFMTVSVQGYMYKKILEAESVKDRLNELGKYSFDANFDFIFRITKYNYFKVKFYPYFSYKNSNSRKDFFFFSFIPAVGVRIAKTDFFILTAELQYFIAFDALFFMTYLGAGISPLENLTLNLEYQFVLKEPNDSFKSHKCSAIIAYLWENIEFGSGLYYIKKDFDETLLKEYRYIVSISYNFDFLE